MTIDKTWQYGARMLAVGLLALALPASAQDDSVLFSAAVPPNVLVILDNSGSMNEIAAHPAYDPNVASTCATFVNSATYYYANDVTMTTCGNTRTIFDDSKINPLQIRYPGHYLNWYFSDAADAAYAQITVGNNGFPSSCVGGPSYAKYKRARITAAKQALKDIVCNINQTGTVKWGLAVMREAADPNGGYVMVNVEEYNSTQAADFDANLQSIDADAQTTLGETLFQAYTFFMSREDDDVPVGKDGITKFPTYSYSRSSSGGGGAYTTNDSQIPPDPVEYSCQKNFVIVITDGTPERDDFDVELPSDRARGFADFKNKLIGDYNADGEVEEPLTSGEEAYYLDDIALYMQENDFRPDMSDDQTIDTYTIGFGAKGSALALLQKTAAVGNGLFYASTTSEELVTALLAAFADIIEKSQTFTAATVPATRTAEGGSFYTTVFVPTGKSPYWEGHLKRYTIAGNGDILDKNGDCAIDDPVVGSCKSGSFLPGAEPFWDAGEEVPDPAARNLATSNLVGGVPTKVDFTTSLSAADLDVTVFPPMQIYPGSTALNAEGLTDEIIQNVRGCKMGTGVSSTDVATPLACETRPWLLGDIFHSNPVVLGRPSSPTFEPSHADFKTLYGDRDRVILAGANDGFLRGFHAGDWDAAADPPAYDAGTGEELFGFMPWVSRKKIQYLPNDTGGRNYYFVDGSPAAADVWIHSSPTDTTKDASEWLTLVVEGLRQGGEQYFALDMTDPSSAGYPQLQWEFPREDTPAAIKDYVGQTWGQAILTRVRISVGGNDNGGKGFERWVAIVSAGYDVTSDPNHVSYAAASKKGRGLFMIDAKTGEVLAQKLFGVATGQVPTMSYALAATPAVFDLDFDGFADVIYQADLGGNVWKWVVKAIGEDPIAGGGDVTQPAWPIRKFFSAPTATVSGTTYYKSFFYPPSATLVSNKLWLVFGSGERANLPFVGVTGTAENNRVYSVNDPDPHDQLSPALATVTETDLSNLSVATGCPNLTNRGFYLVAGEGEKFVTNSEIFSGYAVLASYTPTPSSDPCEVGGLSALYGFRVQCGEGLFPYAGGDPTRTLDIGVGMPTDPRLTVSPEDGGNRLIINKQEGTIENLDAPELDTSGLGLIYWRELPQ